LNSGYHTCYAGILPLVLLHQPFCVGNFWDRKSFDIYTRLDFNPLTCPYP
jgi:hypothetical protein